MPQRRWLAAVDTLALLLARNEYLYQSVLLSSTRNMTAVVAITQFINGDESHSNHRMAAAIIYSLPPIAIFCAFRRFMAAGLTRGQRDARKSVIRDAARIIIPMRSGSIGSASDDTLAITTSRERSTTRNWPWMP